MGLKDDTISFLNSWHKFPIDYWWRKKYNVPFGSKQHREMSFIDMCIEYEEELVIKKSLLQLNKEQEDKENKELGIDFNGGTPISQKEIDDDYDNLDLSNF